MIKHNSADSVTSLFNPIVSLNPQFRKQVNENFIYPILKLFFSTRGGIESFHPLDSDKLITEIEFCDLEEELVKPYIYGELMNEISKSNGDSRVLFRPRYLISFDRDLTRYKRDNKKYPYKSIFDNSSYKEEDIRYGVIRLGDAPVLYIVFIELQEIIRYIKRLSISQSQTEPVKVAISQEERRNELLNQLIAKEQGKLRGLPNTDKDRVNREISRLLNLSNESLKGERGRLRVNLSWATTDDLDLHIENEFGGKINYQNKVLELNGAIGKLDVDANAGSNLVSNPQENIVWDMIPEGRHTISVNLYNNREGNEKISFTVYIDNGGDSRIYNSYVEDNPTNKTKQIAVFQFVNGGLKFEEILR